MLAETFEQLVEEQLQRCRDVLVTKAKEYAKTDRLHNFKQAAHLQGITPIQALSGMMGKHTVSVYDMMQSDETFSLAQWGEKIDDHMNYLILLKALVIEKDVPDA